eukprot:14820598-Heterocapsa_arctica.AAC.1
MEVGEWGGGDSKVPVQWAEDIAFKLCFSQCGNCCQAGNRQPSEARLVPCPPVREVPMGEP